MKMTRAEKLAVMEAAHAAQRAYHKILDQAHADIGKAIQDMPEGTTFTAAELASAAGVCYQAMFYLHTSDRMALDIGRETSTKRYAAILPDGSVDLGQTIQITKTTTTYTRTSQGPGNYGNRYGRAGYQGDPTEILDYLQRLARNGKK